MQEYRFVGKEEVKKNTRSEVGFSETNNKFKIYKVTR